MPQKNFHILEEEVLKPDLGEDSVESIELPTMVEPSAQHENIGCLGEVMYGMRVSVSKTVPFVDDAWPC